MQWRIDKFRYDRWCGCTDGVDQPRWGRVQSALLLGHRFVILSSVVTLVCVLRVELQQYPVVDGKAPPTVC